MFAPDDFLPRPVSAPWALSDDQRNMYTASRRFARDRLEPLFAGPPSVTVWQETIRLAAATLDLGTMVLPEKSGGIAIDRHDLVLVAEALAAGPIERAIELTLTAPALMTLRAHDALDPVLAQPVQAYFDGTTAIALCVPEFESATVWQLGPLEGVAAFTMLIDGEERLIVAKRARDRQSSRSIRIATLGGLVLERLHFDAAEAGTPLATIAQPNCDGIPPAQTCMTDAGLYLSALLIGSMQHSVQFAFDYAATRHAFRKPLASHQLVATRLSNMLIATHGAHLFVQSVATAHQYAPVSLVRQLIRHVASESLNVSRDLVQLCGGHGYVEGLPPASRFQTIHWLACLLLRIDAALEWLTEPHPKNAEVDA
ncbi:acyl-CoA dehydrogenase family protein [Burkholderia cepacia]|uniref:acyl-CoA dehydrogenase family protein n=1 Tax=Burkholderia cepacia TaxID=292 RepID=UPI00158B1232|nr:acyl-CoA dehydrogenase family protein [Burkholderia cepacia]